MKALLAALLFVVGCLPTGTTMPVRPQLELERRVAEVGLEAWRAAGLKTTPAASALLRLRVHHHATEEAFLFACPPAVYGKAQACLSWLDRGEVPIANVSPRMTGRYVYRLALHEWLHAAVYRFGRRPDYDRDHLDGSVWAGFAWSLQNCVEALAQLALEELWRPP